MRCVSRGVALLWVASALLLLGCEPEFPVMDVVAMEAATDIVSDRSSSMDVQTDAQESGMTPSDARPDAPMDSVVDAVDVPAPMEAAVDVFDAAPTDVVMEASTPSGGTCAMPAGTLMRGMTVRGTASGTSRSSTASCAAGARSPGAVLTFEMVDYGRMELTASSSTMGARLALSVLRQCDDPSSEIVCDADANRDGNSVVSRVFEPGVYSVFVSRVDRDEPFEYQVSMAYTDRSVLGTCTGSTSQGQLSTTGDPSGSDLRGALFPSRACDIANDGPAIIRRVLLPAQTRNLVTVTPAAGADWRVRVRAMPACENTTCRASGISAMPGAPVTLTLDNGSNMPRFEYISAAGASEREYGGNVQFQQTSIPIGTIENCVSATPVVPGTPLLNRRSDGEGRDVGYCETPAPGPFRFYRVNVPAGRRVRFTVTPQGSPWSVQVRHLDSCPSFRCAQVASSAAPGSAVTITTDNPWDTARDLQFAVAATDGLPHDYDVQAELTTNLAYVARTITASCDELLEENALPGGSMLNATTRTLPIPIMFQYFGFFPTHYAVSTNGNVQFFRSETGVADASPMNAVIPTSGGPNWFIAPFWDALTPVLGRAQIRAAFVDGIDGRRYTIQWVSYGVATDRTSSTNFQVKLFERSNVIELHWCSLVGARDTSTIAGTSATIGLENIDGTDGVMLSHQQWEAASTRTALRLTPR